MSTPTTPVEWVSCKERLPDLKTHGPYPRVLVAISHHQHPEYGHGVLLAELRFVNGDKNRPLWLSTDSRHEPIENCVRGVTHWANPPEGPKV